jgi:autoinducer 2-degrading protein
MIVTLVYVQVKSEYVKEFTEATRENHKNSVTENGNIRFDILQDANDPSKFVLYEAYATEQAAAAHKETPHYLAWRDKVAPWMAKPREGVKHKLLFPERV